MLKWGVGMLFSLMLSTAAAWNENDEQRYHQLNHAIRCVVCQNQSIADSGTPIAEQIRAWVHSAIESGKSNEEILEALSQQYGEFIRYQPAFNSHTWALWLAPIALFLVALLGWVRSIRR